MALRSLALVVRSPLPEAGFPMLDKACPARQCQARLALARRKPSGVICMSLAVAIQMDPIERIDIDADSTFVLALEAQRRGHGLYHYLPTDLSYDHGRVKARARPLQVRREHGNHASQIGRASCKERV